MRHIDQPCTVTLVRDDEWDAMRPSQFIWRRGRYHVERVLDSFVIGGRWWLLEEGVTIWRVLCRDGGVYELEQKGTQWRLATSFD